MDNFTKITYVDSASDVTPPPYPTPATDPAHGAIPMPSPDLAAVNRNLEPITEELNEAAEVAAYPSAPAPTLVMSAPPSVICPVCKHRSVRNGSVGVTRAIANLRLLNLESGQPSHSTMCQNAETCGHPHHLGDLMSEGGAIDVALGSPNTNPRIAEYLAYGPENAEAAIVNQGIQEGVTEKSYWADEVMGDLERACMRLEQLAEDEAQVTGASAGDVYLSRLHQVLAAEERKHKITAARLE